MTQYTGTMTSTSPAGSVPWAAIRNLLGDLGSPIYVRKSDNQLSLETTLRQGGELQGIVPAILPQDLGDPGFLRDHGVRMAYYAGAMANGINSEEMVIALGRQQILCSFGAGGLSRERIAAAISRIMQALPHGPFAINLLHNPGEPDWEMDVVRLCIQNGVRLIEASAYMKLTPAIVYYRAAGLERQADGSIRRRHRVISKISRAEVAQHFIRPAPDDVLRRLLGQGLITAEQAEMMSQVPMADDLTVEADSGGHTDNGILACALPSIIALRDRIADTMGEAHRVRVGAAGGIGNPQAVYSAFSLGAAFVCTGSINQACREAATSPVVKDLLAKARCNDVSMAPSADMFELGAKVQVLKGGTLYPMRAQKLHALYKQYDSLEDIPENEKEALEKSIFRQPMTRVWQETEAFFRQRGNTQLIRAANENPRKKMALLFQWYLGQSSRWAIAGASDRAMDYQVWCGPAMGAVNEWLDQGPYAAPENRSVCALAQLMMQGAAYLARAMVLKHSGIEVEGVQYGLRPWLTAEAIPFPPEILPSANLESG